MIERDAFLKALAENEDDTMTRLVYADWLEERGEHEEADRQRKWPAAKEWLVRFCRDHCDPSDENLDSEGPNDANPYSFLHISFKQMLELGRKAVEEADERGTVGSSGNWFVSFECGANEELAVALRANRQEFWDNWSVVTGIPLPPDVEEKSYFGCSC
jgi:uncharacterized protein (TIGR02996 family)